VIYCRESRDEGGEKRERIAFQQKTLEDYAESRKLGKIIRVIVDDDMTGTDFSRLDGIRTMVGAGAFDILLIKDSSRLGRNLTESLLFIEFLEKNGITLVFQSQPFHRDFFPLEAWFNEMRAKEDSRKIRDVIYHKMERAEFLVAAPYGYRKEGGGLVPEEEEAEVVGFVYRAFLEGATTGELARKLDDRAIPTPSRSKKRKDAALRWSAASVRRILSDEVYTGDLILKKSVGRSFKDKTRLILPEEERIIHRNHHHPLVNRDDFEKAGEKLKKSQRGKGKGSPFPGMLYCASCGKEMTLRRDRDGRAYFVCTVYHRQGKKACHAHKVEYRDITGIVRGAACALLSEEYTSVPPKNTRTAMAALYEDFAAGRMEEETFYAMRSRLLSPSPQREEIPDPTGYEERIAPLLIDRITVCEAGDMENTRDTLLVRLRF